MVADNSAPAGSPAPIAVVLDANVMWNQWTLSGASWEGLRSLVGDQRIALYVPEVVVQEVVRGRHHDANELVSELDKLKLARVEKLLQLGLPKNKRDLTSRAQAAVADYDSELRSRLDQLRAVVIPVPEVSHQEVLTRAMDRRRPFDGAGRGGYRDVLIWHSVLDIAKHGHAGIVFVTNNTSDFCTGKPPVLLPLLEEELDIVSPKVNVVVATEVNRISACVAELERLIEVDGDLPEFQRPSDDDVRAVLNLCVDVIVAGAEPPTAGRWGEDLWDGWQFRSILEEEGRDVVSIDFTPDTLVCEPDGGWAEFTAQIQAEVTLDGFAYKADVYAEEDISLDIQDSDWNDHYMQVHEYHQAKLTFRLLLNDSGSVVEECWLSEAEEVERKSDIGDRRAEE